MKQVVSVNVFYDDAKFAHRPEDIIHTIDEGLRSQFGPRNDSGIHVEKEYVSRDDPAWQAEMSKLEARPKP